MNIASCVSIDLTNVPNINEVVRWTTAPIDLVHNGNTFRSVGALLSIGKINVENTIRSSPLTLTLTGLDMAILNLMTSTDIQRPKITITSVMFPDDSNLVSSSEIYFKGRGSQPEQNVTYPSGDKAGFVTLSMECRSIYGMDQKAELMRCNAQTHEFYHPGDQFFKYANVDQKDDVMWRR